MTSEQGRPLPETIQQSRTVDRVIQGIGTSDGAGVKLTRVITPNLQQRLDPFLMLDAFGSDDPNDYIAGFPDHPHRGFETVTYMIAGRMRHRDSGGNEGLLQNGGVQWMTAGKGLIHSELPEQESGVMEGFQLWLNLPAHLKMTQPAYRDIQSDAIPGFELASGVSARVIAGSSHGIKGAVSRPVTDPLYLDIHFDASGVFTQRIRPNYNAFIYVYRGRVDIAGRVIEKKHMAILNNEAHSDGVSIRGDASSKILLIAGKPLNEPIAQYGPFVMNTKQELYQAVADFQNGLFHGSPRD